MPMRPEEQIVNKVANSSLITFDLEALYEPGERMVFDIKDILYEGLLLREKDLREFIKNHNWSQYENKFVAINCSADAIIPTWAFMLVAIALAPFAKRTVFGTLEDLEVENYREVFLQVDWDKFHGAKVVVKGCSKVEVPVAVYVMAVNKLRPYAASLMFGEPCSTVPLYKKR
jgi:hypothetical protein